MIKDKNRMKIYYSIIIGFIFLCSAAFTTKHLASTWAATANNETVSRNALADAVANTIFYQKAAFTGSTRQITKAEAAAWVYLNEAASPFAGKASNQLVIKTDLVAVTPIYVTIASSYDGGTGLTIEITVSAALPAETTIFFNWCTDSGAEGDVTFVLPVSFAGTTTATANLSATGAVTGTYATGSVTTSSPSIVNAMYVKAPSLTFTTSDNTRPYLLTYESVDNACANLTTVIDECVNCN
jgi:hypothetical protein